MTKKRIIFSILLVVASVYAFNFLTMKKHDLTGKKVIVIGASSGIGAALAKKFSKEGCDVGLVARRVDRLEKLAEELPGKSFIKRADVSKPEDAREQVRELIDDMGGMDIMVVNSGVGVATKELIWEKQKRTIGVNVVGFTAMATLGMNHFMQQKHGHLVGISSIAALRGLPHAAAYSASKAYVSNYLQGLRTSADVAGLPIHVTDIKPGFVLTDMTRHQKGMFWVASPEVAADQIYDATAYRCKHVYVTKRWRLVGWMLKIMPDWMYAQGMKKA